MTSLRCVAKMLIKQHRLPRIIASFASAISTSAPKPNLGNHETKMSNESVRIELTKLLSEPNVVGGSSIPNKTDEASDNDCDPKVVNLPKPSKNEMPAMTIVDINSGYGRMDFEERMDHMDLVDRISDTKLPKSSAPPMMPLIRELPSVVNVDGYSDDMMYEDKPEDTQPQPSAIKSPNAESTKSNNGANDKEDSLSPLADEAQRVAETPPATQNQEARSDPIMKAGACTPTTTAVDIFDSNICIAPVDIDAFPKEDEVKNQGTVDIDAFGDDECLQLPPIPKVRNNVFQFKGIKVIMPKRMLRDETYRYRLDPTDKDKPDDMHICIFEK
ncbi:uncharacterized protein [Eurosta solidaginis]|uniref:uncharacterized protein n=1 Tax=Eurosta solidaginis TaxID=178769 RepID=UPI0035307BBE